MPSKSLPKRIAAALSAFEEAEGPMARLDAARRLREAAEELEAAEVEAARKAGVTWIEIGACYSLTKQGAQQRFRAPRAKDKDRDKDKDKKKTAERKEQHSDPERTAPGGSPLPM